MNWPRLSYLVIHQLWKKVQQVVLNALFTTSEIVVAFGLARFPGPFCLGFISFHFLF